MGVGRGRGIGVEGGVEIKNSDSGDYSLKILLGLIVMGIWEWLQEDYAVRNRRIIEVNMEVGGR